MHPDAYVGTSSVKYRPPSASYEARKLHKAHEVLHELAKAATEDHDSTDFHVLMAAAKLVHKRYMDVKYRS